VPCLSIAYSCGLVVRLGVEVNLQHRREALLVGRVIAPATVRGSHRVQLLRITRWHTRWHSVAVFATRVLSRGKVQEHLSRNANVRM